MRAGLLQSPNTLPHDELGWRNHRSHLLPAPPSRAGVPCPLGPRGVTPPAATMEIQQLHLKNWTSDLAPWRTGGQPHSAGGARSLPRACGCCRCTIAPPSCMRHRVVEPRATKPAVSSRRSRGTLPAMSHSQPTAGGLLSMITLVSRLTRGLGAHFHFPLRCSGASSPVAPRPTLTRTRPRAVGAATTSTTTTTKPRTRPALAGAPPTATAMGCVVAKAACAREMLGPRSYNVDYHWNEAWNPQGAGKCANDCECDGLRNCVSGSCTGEARPAPQTSAANRRGQGALRDQQRKEGS